MGVETPTSTVQLGSELVNVNLSKGSNRTWDCDWPSITGGRGEEERD